MPNWQLLHPRVEAFKQRATEQASSICEVYGHSLDKVEGDDARVMADYCEERGLNEGACLLRFIADRCCRYTGV